MLASHDSGITKMHELEVIKLYEEIYISIPSIFNQLTPRKTLHPKRQAD